MSEALRQVVWKCDRCGGDAQAIFGIFPSCKCGSTSFKAAQPPAPTAQPAPMSQPNRLIAYSAAAKLREIGYVWDEKSGKWEAAQPVQQPGAEPDGRLHADGYFTWKRRDGYVLDAKLPCDFYLAAPAQRQPLSDDTKTQMWRAAYRDDPRRLGSFEWYAQGVEDAEAAHKITAAPEAQKGEKL